MGAKIALSAGHGRNTAGKRCLKSLDSAQTREWVLNDRIARKVAALLEGYEIVENCRKVFSAGEGCDNVENCRKVFSGAEGCQNVENCRKVFSAGESCQIVENCRKVFSGTEGCDNVENCRKKVEVLRVDDPTGQKDIPLSDRVKAAQDFGAQLYLSLHHNAGILGGKGGGIVAYVHPDAGEEAKLWQKELYDALVAATGLKGNRATPLAARNLKELRLAAMPAALLELGFMDSKTDVPVILSEAYADQCAGAIVSVLAARMGLTKKPPEPEQKAPLCKGSCHRCAVTGGLSSATEPEPTDQSTTEPALYRVQVGAFSSLENAQKLKQRLHAAGFPEAYIRR